MKKKISIKPEITKLSSKGQIVIPQDIRAEMHAQAGSVFAVTAFPRRDLIVLKKIDNPILEEDLAVLREVEKAWREIESGKSKIYEGKEFFEKLRAGRL